MFVLLLALLVLAVIVLFRERKWRRYAEKVVKEYGRIYLKKEGWWPELGNYEMHSFNAGRDWILVRRAPLVNGGHVEDIELVHKKYLGLIEKMKTADELGIHLSPCVVKDLEMIGFELRENHLTPSREKN